MNKYKAKSCQVGNEKYRSRRELDRHHGLLLQQRCGLITGLVREVPFVLALGIKITGESRKRPSVRYIADFVYCDVAAGGVIVVEDCKGVQTPMYRLKKHLMATIHGVHIRES